MHADISKPKLFSKQFVATVTLKNFLSSVDAIKARFQSDKRKVDEFFGRRDNIDIDIFPPLDLNENMKETTKQFMSKMAWYRPMITHIEFQYFECEKSVSIDHLDSVSSKLHQYFQFVLLSIFPEIQRT